MQPGVNRKSCKLMVNSILTHVTSRLCCVQLRGADERVSYGWLSLQDDGELMDADLPAGLVNGPAGFAGV